MTNGEIEKRLWAAADQLWANSGLRPADFSTPVLGLIFLRYAEKRFAEVEARIGPVGSGTRHTVGKEDYQAEGVIFLPPEARFSHLQSLPESGNIGRALSEAMQAIEDENPDLAGVLPHTYTQIENTILIELIRLLGPVEIEGDAFGKVYEYFLGNFATREGLKGGVFYTPISIVRLIVEINIAFRFTPFGRTPAGPFVIEIGRVPTQLREQLDGRLLDESVLRKPFRDLLGGLRVDGFGRGGILGREGAGDQQKSSPLA